MAMIQPLDGGFLLQAYQAGQDRRIKMREMRQAEESEKQWKGLVGNLYGDQGSGGGVAGQYAPSRPQREPSFDEAFGGETQQAMEQGQSLPELPQQQQAPTYQGPRRINQDVLQQMIILRPEVGTKIAEGLAKMDEAQVKQMAAKNDLMGAAAKFIQEQGPEGSPQRAAAAQKAIAYLAQSRLYSAEELDGVDNDLSDLQLRTYQGVAIDYDKIIDNELAARVENRQEREFEAGKTVPVTAGGSVALVKPDGTSRYIVGGPEGPTATPPPEAIAELKANPGTADQFDEIFGEGAAARALGGGGGDVTGNFPAGQ